MNEAAVARQQLDKHVTIPGTVLGNSRLTVGDGERQLTASDRQIVE
jgi:hypothetical protein